MTCHRHQASAPGLTSGCVDKRKQFALSFCALLISFFLFLFLSFLSFFSFFLFLFFFSLRHSGGWKWASDLGKTDAPKPKISSETEKIMLAAMYVF